MNIRDRREPTVPERSGSSNRPNSHEPDEVPTSRSETPAISTMTSFALAVIAAACVFFVAERLYAWYVAKQAINELTEISEAALTNAQRSMQELSAQQAMRQREIRRKNEARIAAVRQERAQSVTGQWLSKNCSDWKRSWEQFQAETAREEMEKHCGRFQRYLDTGISPPDVPRASKP